MDSSLRNTFGDVAKNIHDEAKRTGKVKTSAEIKIGNNRVLTIIAVPVRNWLFHKKTTMVAEYKTLDGRECTVNFDYDKGRGIARGLQSFEGKIAQADSIANKISQFSSRIDNCTKQMSTANMNSLTRNIENLLGDIDAFVQQSNLTKKEISKLQAQLQKLEDSNIVGTIKKYCPGIASQAKSIKTLLNDKAKQVGNTPPEADADVTSDDDESEEDIDMSLFECKWPGFWDKVNAEKSKASSSQSSSTKTTEETSSKSSLSKTETPQVSTERPEALTSESIFSKIAAYAKRSISIQEHTARLREIHTFLCDVEKFVKENDLSTEEVSKLKQELQNLCGAEIMGAGRWKSSINKVAAENDPDCQATASKAKSLETLLNDKAKQVESKGSTSPEAGGNTEGAQKVSGTATPQVSTERPEWQKCLYFFSQVNVYIAKSIPLSHIKTPSTIPALSPEGLRAVQTRMSLGDIENIFLVEVEKLVKENDLTKEEISTLKQELQRLCDAPIIKSPEGDLSIKKCDCSPICKNIASRAESIETLLNDKERQIESKGSTSPEVGGNTGGAQKVSGMATPQVSTERPEALTFESISSKISGHIDERTSATPDEISNLLGEAEKLVRENNLTKKQTLALQTQLQKLYNAEIITVGENFVSMNKGVAESNPDCQAIASKAKSLETLLNR